MNSTILLSIVSDNYPELLLYNKNFQYETLFGEKNTSKVIRSSFDVDLILKTYNPVRYYQILSFKLKASMSEIACIFELTISNYKNITLFKTDSASINIRIGGDDTPVVDYCCINIHNIIYNFKIVNSINSLGVAKTSIDVEIYYEIVH